ncbi:carbohydrate binding domain-containing protein [Thermobispora bispora]|uniref:Carbohydrate-binding CenC domain protein n=1 Tax=Thermobispora bispora (strain ATCC 19993 / DSM 43833 / CBS 139.67 / JCM 10125 / KCTC 9307 / NBRC 14880 / R51) TaxID=469371 RepID=D6Y7S5_THEBD|nr:carbohydrate binding domain-containing protein [Thermobispora bispora]ADG87744.1 Carbohydrate-binding CenC domain protein [Thermobispora bispora DSM 43833]MBO2473081.1 carbohydrate-binding protein [Actinomycetales bacterium]
MRGPLGLGVAAALVLSGLFTGTAHAENLVTNPGFESGLSGWTCSPASGAQAVSSPVHAGSRALAATPTSSDHARCEQTISVRPSTTYTLSAWVRGNYVFLGATGDQVNAQTWASPGSAWTRLTTSFTTGPSTGSVTVYLHGWYGQGTYHADDVELDGGHPAPSPSPSQSPSPGESPSPSPSVPPSPSPSPSASPSPGTPPAGEITFAPYIDITMPTPSLTDAYQATGVKHYTLAFVLGDSTGCNPSWGGTIPIDDPRIINDVRALQARGGQVIVATGGALGPYLEHVCATPAALLAAYKKALDTVGTNHLDVDIEASIDAHKVNTALKQLQDERGTTISYTLRVQGQDYGVDPFSVQILQDAAAKGLEVLVNPMLMNFGHTGNWGEAMVSAAEATLGQMREIWPGKSEAQLKRMLGLTPMIGRNDTGPITTQADARTLLSYAQANHVGRIAFWSVGRDNGGCPDGTLSPTCSGIAQSPYEFTRIFAAYTG